MIVVVKFWKPKTIMRLDSDHAEMEALTKHSSRETFVAWLPYLLLVVFVLMWGQPSIKAKIDGFTNGLLPAWVPKATTGMNGITVPGLHHQIQRVPPVTGKPAPYAAVYVFNWLSASGTACLLATDRKSVV